MADREKVIKALRSCVDCGCQGCPYFEYRKEYGQSWCTTVMAQDALELLKEQDEKIRQLRLALSIMNGKGIVIKENDLDA